MSAARGPEAWIGRVLQGRFRLDNVLGEGGLATVYAATDPDGRRVAVKVLHPELAVFDDMRSRLEREAVVARRVAHPGVVSVLEDHVTEESESFLVMELLDGETLESLREQRGGALDPRFVLATAGAALDVLAAVHSMGIIHRDLKPENLFYTSDGQVKVLDFGIARLPDLPSTDPTLIPGLSIGTPAFMPPEQAQGRWDLLDARSDLWALGATMFTLLTGREVYSEETRSQTLAAAATRRAPPLSSAWPGAPEALAAVIDRALAFEQRERWPDARAMQRAVRDA